MSDLPSTCKIWLKAGVSEKYINAKVFFPTWETADGKIEKDISGTPSEEYSTSMVKWNIEAMIRKTESDGDKATTGWFLNTFLPAINTKEMKEDGGSYTDVVIEENKIPFNPAEYVLGFANLKFTLIEV